MRPEWAEGERELEGAGTDGAKQSGQRSAKVRRNVTSVG